MLTVDYFHMCDYAFQAEGGKPCVIGIFDSIGASEFPVAHPQMCLAIQFTGASHETVTIAVQLSQPNGEAIASMNGPITLNQEGRAFVQLNLMGVVFPQPGRYSVTVSASGQTLASKSMTVQHVRQPQAGRAGVAH